MATIKFILQSESETAQIYLRLSMGRGRLYKRKTSLVINPKEWTELGFPNQETEENRELTKILKGLKDSILYHVNNSNSKGIEINGSWLQSKIDMHFGRNKNNKTEKLRNQTKITEQGLLELGFEQSDGDFFELVIIDRNRMRPNYEFISLATRTEQNLIIWLNCYSGSNPDQASVDLHHIKYIEQLRNLISALSGTIHKDVSELEKNEYVKYIGGSKSNYLIKGNKYRLTCKPFNFGKRVAVINESGKRMNTNARFFIPA